MRCKNFLLAHASSVLFSSLLLGALAATTASSVAQYAPHEIVLTVPVGRDGVQYEGEHPEMLPWGPIALAVAPDGSFWLADGVGNRLLHYSSTGSLLNTVNLAGLVVGIGDLEVTCSNIWVLDIASPTPKILCFSLDGKLLDYFEIPQGLRLEDGLSGIAISDKGELLIEREGGASVSLLLKVGDKATHIPLEGHIQRGRLYITRPADLTSAETSKGYIKAGGTEIVVTVPHILGSLRFLGSNPDGSFYVLLEELYLDGVLQVDQRIHLYSPEGKLLGMARVPLSEQYVYVPHSVAVGPDGSVYALITHPDRVEVQRLKFAPELKPVFPQVPAKREPQTSENEAIVLLSCVSRTTMMNIASGYTSNSKYLSSTNTDGACSGRGKPRYIRGAGTYPSVPYDWGGWDTVRDYNNYMYPNTYKAGDISTPSIESCSRGVDCSGFVSRVWQLRSKHSTSTLPNVSRPLQDMRQLLPGDILNKSGFHVVLFVSFASNGAYVYESTTSNAYDRVVYVYRGWNYLSGYIPRRYNNVCP